MSSCQPVHYAYQSKTARTCLFWTSMLKVYGFIKLTETMSPQKGSAKMVIDFWTTKYAVKRGLSLKLYSISLVLQNSATR